jgi:hypothetical protein
VRYERRIVLTALLGAAPVAVTALFLVFSGDFSMRVRCAVAAVLVSSALVSAYALHRQIASRLRTFAKIIVALGVDDDSPSGDSSLREDAVGETVLEINALARLMESHHLDGEEAIAVLRTVLAQIVARATCGLPHLLFYRVFRSTRGPFPSRSS